MAMALVKLPDNGQEFPLDEAIAGSDDMLKSALRSVYPEIGDPQIKREQKDGQMVVTVVKQAGRKGGDGVGVGEGVQAGFDLDAGGDTVYGVAAPSNGVIIPPPAEVALFDYSALDIESRIVVQQRAHEIKGLMRRAGEDIVEIGRKMIEVKARLPHGKFTPWLQAEFGCSLDTANNFMNVAQHFGNNPKVSDYAPSALYLLAAPATPQSAREEALARVEEGERVGPSVAREIITEHRTAQAQADETLTPQVVENGERTYEFQPDPVTVAGRFKPTLFDGLEVEGQEAAPEAETVEAEGVVETEDAVEPQEVPASPAPKPAAPASAPAPAPVPTPASAPALQPAVTASFEKSTITVTMQLFPDDGNDLGRMVLLAARVEGQNPATSMHRMGDLLPMPPAVLALLDQVRQQTEAALAVAEAAKGKK